MTEFIALIATVLVAIFMGRHDAKKNQRLKQELEHERQKVELAKKISEIRDDIRVVGNTDLRQRLRNHRGHTK